VPQVLSVVFLYLKIKVAPVQRGGGKLKVRVRHDFRDKEKGLELRKQNSTLTLKEDRAKKLISLGLVEEIKPEKGNGKEAAG